MEGYRSLAAQEFSRWLASRRAHVLLDVRQPEEWERASISGALRMPMPEVQARIAEIPRDRPVVVMCHVGGRSAYVARFLASAGFAEVYNLDGGIDAYAQVVDPSIARY